MLIKVDQKDITLSRLCYHIYIYIYIYINATEEYKYVPLKKATGSPQISIYNDINNNKKIVVRDINPLLSCFIYMYLNLCVACNCVRLFVRSLRTKMVKSCAMIYLRFIRPYTKVKINKFPWHKYCS